MSLPRKPSVASVSKGGESRRGSAVATESSTRTASPARVLSTQGTAKSSSKDPSYVARPNRASMQVRRPSSIIGSIGNIEDVAKDDNIRIEQAALVDNLKKSLRTADIMAEEQQAQMAVLQKKYDDLLKDHGKLEEQFGDTTQKLGELEAKRKEDSRSVREMANLYESERISMLRDREEAAQREEELRRSIQRLKETMAGREMRFNIAADHDRRLSRSATRGRSDERSSSVDERAHFAPPNDMQRRGSSVHRSESKQASSRLVMQKDILIENLRLELAEAHLKLVEMENMGGNHMQEVEKQLLETRMSNAKLMEENESFQLLLGERSFSGDIMKSDLISGTPLNGTGLTSLAEELESAEGESEKVRRLEQELKLLREEKKALTLYIDKIISRVLQHDNNENILDAKATAEAKAQAIVPKDESEKPSVIQRAMSVVGPRKRPMSQLITGTAAANLQQEIAAAGKTRPQSQQFFSPVLHTPTAHEDPNLAPSIPLGRTMSMTRAQRHRRTQSTQSAGGNDHAGTTSLISQMYPSQNPDPGAISPVSPGTTIPRQNYFSGAALREASATPPRSIGVRSTSAQQSGLRESESSISRPTSRQSNEVPSPPRNAAGNTVFTGAVMTQNKLRPLRLVQQKKEDDNERAKQEAQAVADEETARKRANRASWMPGWFSKGPDTPRTPASALPE